MVRPLNRMGTKDDVGPDYIVLIIMVCLIISIIVRIVVRQFNICVSQNAFLLAIAVMYGVMSAQIGVLAPLREIVEINPDMYFHTFVAVFVPATMYRLEYYIYVRCIPQVLIMVLLGVFISALCLGAILSFILHNHWSYAHGVLSALATIPIQPLHVVLLFHDVAKYRYLRTILEAESVLLLIPVCLLYQILLGITGRFVTRWQQVVYIIIRHVVGGYLVGTILGKVTGRVLRWLYNEPGNAMIVSLGMNYFVYFFAQKLLACSGALAIVMLNLYIMMEKHRFTDEVNRTLTTFWNSLHYMAEISILMISTATLTIHVLSHFEVRYLYGTIMIYLSGMSLRILRLLIMSPLLNAMTYDLNVRCLLILGWSDIKGCINLIMVLRLLNQAQTTEIVRNCMIEILVYTFLSIFINTSSVLEFLRLLGFMEMSQLRRQNMNNCTTSIMEKRAALISILKIKRMMLLANWHRMRLDTFIPSPYAKGATQYDVVKHKHEALQVEKEQCPGCVTDLPGYTAENDLKDLLIESEANILKAKKVSIIKQYEHGVISKYSLGVLVHYFEIMIDTSRDEHGLNINRFLKKNTFLMMIRELLIKFYAHKPYRTSKSHCGNICFYFTMHIGYELSKVAMIIAYAIISITIDDDTVSARVGMHALHVVMTVVFLFDFIFQLFGLSNVWLVISGIRPYFARKRNIADFILLAYMIINLRLCDAANVYVWWYFYVMPPARLLAVVRLLQIPNMLNFLCPFLIKCIDDRIDAWLCFDYDLTSALVNTADEIFEILPQLIELKMIRDIYRKSLSEERSTLVRKMETLQKERPWIATTVKTKQAIRTTLTVMLESLNEFKISGLVDNIEYMFIFDEIFKKEKVLRGMKFVPACPPKVIFKEVLWMGDDDEAQAYLFENAQIVKWHAGKRIMRNGGPSMGIYIIVSGMLRLKYQPSEEFIANRNGCLPVVDYLSTMTFHNPIDDNIVTGNSIGELSVLTKRLYNCTVYAVLPTTAYWLPVPIIMKAMKIGENRVNGLESRMWKCSLIYMAITILLDCPLYKSYTPQQVKLKLERSFVPNLDEYQVFIVTERMDNVLLLEGVVSDHSTGEKFVAPMLIPITVQKLAFPEAAFVKDQRHPNTLQPRLMIIPLGDAKENEIMEQEEQIAEFAITASRFTGRGPRRLTNYSGQFVWSKPSEAAVEFDWGRVVSIIKLDKPDEKDIIFDEEFHTPHSYIKENRLLKHDKSDDRFHFQEDV